MLPGPVTMTGATYYLELPSIATRVGRYYLHRDYAMVVSASIRRPRPAARMLSELCNMRLCWCRPRCRLGIPRGLIPTSTAAPPSPTAAVTSIALLPAPTPPMNPWVSASDPSPVAACCSGSAAFRTNYSYLPICRGSTVLTATATFVAGVGPTSTGTIGPTPGCRFMQVSFAYTKLLCRPCSGRHLRLSGDTGWITGSNRKRHRCRDQIHRYCDGADLTPIPWHDHDLCPHRQRLINQSLSTPILGSDRDPQWQSTRRHPLAIDGRRVRGIPWSVAAIIHQRSRRRSIASR